jgi:Holliday junction resolvase RusA-like endonuclease
MITIRIKGTPAPGGSKSSMVHPHTGRRIMLDAGGKRNKIWRSCCEAFARRQIGSTPPLSGPLSVSFEFIMPRPRSHFRSVKKMPVLRDDAPRHHTQAPDRTKLMRSTEDALTGICWVDDAQIVTGQDIIKRWAAPDEEPGAVVTILGIE